MVIKLVNAASLQDNSLGRRNGVSCVTAVDIMPEIVRLLGVRTVPLKEVLLNMVVVRLVVLVPSLSPVSRIMNCYWLTV